MPTKSPALSSVLHAHETLLARFPLTSLLDSDLCRSGAASTASNGFPLSLSHGKPNSTTSAADEKVLVVCMRASIRLPKCHVMCAMAPLWRNSMQFSVRPCLQASVSEKYRSHTSSRKKANARQASAS